ncbi:unnamed protein product [Candidula unifasciata]|uniref:Uncharacterized protein n=1 Tax=Candidula unifasciata TaxID=100452 RepID=A0A8S3YE16_9EUPU|nr:unnamed protein product [Candidula unifasciata]
MKSKGCKIAIHIFALFVSILDFISDWLFYENARALEQGLVYGPVEPTQVTAILVFCIIGTVLFIAEIIAFVIELRDLLGENDDGGKDLYQEILSAVITWCEDIPQLIISVVILLCREEAVSIFQLVKAALSIVGIVVDIVLTFKRYWRQRHFHRPFRIVRSILAPGMLVLLGLSIAVFVLTQTEAKDNGGVAFRQPASVIDDHLSDNKYFDGVNVFLRDSGLPESMKDDKKSDKWMRLFSIYELKDSNQMSVKLTHSHCGCGDFDIGIWFKTAKTNTEDWTLFGCYSVESETEIINPQPNSTCLNNMDSGSSYDVVYIDFRFENPGTNWFYKTMIFGQIYFNCKIYINGTCRSCHFVSSSTEEQQQDLQFLSYFRVNNPIAVNNNTYFYSGNGNEARYFNSGLGDITSVDEVWKTGWSKCASTGGISPVLDSQMKIECN